MKADARALSTLVGVAQGDFRGCLNTLQMLKARHRDVTESLVRSATQGMKEAEVSQTTVLNDLFAPLSRKRAKELGVSEEETRYVSRLSREIEGCDSLDKVAIGASFLVSFVLRGQRLNVLSRLFRTLCKPAQA